MSFVDRLESIGERIFPSWGRKLEERRLGRLSRQLCNVDGLSVTLPADIAAALSSPEAGLDWGQTAQEIKTFELPDSTGGVNKGDQRALYYLLRHFRPTAILEIGTHIGSSTLTMALAARRLRELSGPTATTICSVDLRDVNDAATQPWRQYGSRSAPRDMIERVNCSDFVSFRAESSLTFLDRGDGDYDFIFLDGSHAAHYVYQEVPKALRRLRPGGRILLHDYYPGLKPLWNDGFVVPGVYLAIERLAREGNAIVAAPLGTLPWPTKLGSSVTSLAILSRS
ncbi:MAG: class I SAM-dependent methyltransferase [Pseudomonadota bacterium]|nr:class I SAM-dependent methyltransferase [Pseudomonadota bacterium]